jgi:hypothetical protein
MFSRKSPFTAFILAAFFGPLGMIYVSFGAGFAYFVLNCILVFSVVGIPIIGVTWLVGILHAVSMALEHNKNLSKFVRV